MIEHLLEDLKLRGFARLRPLLPGELAALNGFLLSRPVYPDAHVPQTVRNRIEAKTGQPAAYREEGQVPRAEAAGSECICVHTDDAIVAPHLLERALRATTVAGLYLGRQPPVSYSANVFWTRPGNGPVRGDIQAFHRDTDDERFLAMFIYLTDILHDADGPQDLEGPDGMMRTICGPAGTVFLADTSRQHRGCKPTSGERGIAWWRWGVSDRPAANAWDKIEPVSASQFGARYPKDERLRDSLKLLVTP